MTESLINYINQRLKHPRPQQNDFGRGYNHALYLMNYVISQYFETVSGASISEEGDASTCKDEEDSGLESLPTSPSFQIAFEKFKQEKIPKAGAVIHLIAEEAFKTAWNYKNKRLNSDNYELRKEIKHLHEIMSIQGSVNIKLMEALIKGVKK